MRNTESFITHRARTRRLPKRIATVVAGVLAALLASPAQALTLTETFDLTTVTGSGTSFNGTSASGGYSVDIALDGTVPNSTGSWTTAINHNGLSSAVYLRGPSDIAFTSQDIRFSVTLPSGALPPAPGGELYQGWRLVEASFDIETSSFRSTVSRWTMSITDGVYLESIGVLGEGEDRNRTLVGSYANPVDHTQLDLSYEQITANGGEASAEVFGIAAVSLTFENQTVAVPEPSAAAVATLGLLGLARLGRRRA